MQTGEMLGSIQLPGERIVNGSAADEDGGIYIVTTRAMYRFDTDANGSVTVDELVGRFGVSAVTIRGDLDALEHEDEGGALLVKTLEPAVKRRPALRVALTHVRTFSFKPAWLARGLTSIFVGKIQAEDKHPISRVLFSVYEPVCRAVLRRPRTTIAIAVLVVGISFWLIPRWSIDENARRSAWAGTMSSLESSLTSEMVMPRSTALHMS